VGPFESRNGGARGFRLERSVSCFVIAANEDSNGLTNFRHVDVSFDWPRAYVLRLGAVV